MTEYKYKEILFPDIIKILISEVNKGYNNVTIPCKIFQIYTCNPLLCKMCSQQGMHITIKDARLYIDCITCNSCIFIDRIFFVDLYNTHFKGIKFKDLFVQQLVTIKL